MEEDKIHIMLDIETTGVDIGSGIWQIGAVVMNHMLHSSCPETFLMTINPATVLADPRYKSSLDTVNWQFEKNNSNWSDAFNYPGREGATWGYTPSKSMLVNFSDWLMGFGYENVELWSRGAFDFQLLRAAFKIEDMDCPWKYYQENDQRTLSKWTSYNRNTATPSHNALDDAIQQAKVIAHVFAHLRVYKANAV